VFTPNDDEAELLLGRRLGKDVEADVVELAARYACVVTCDDAVADAAGTRWRVSVGHSGLATSGSGDVLAGAVGGLLARGAEPAQAACWAKYLHSTAGERLAARVGRVGFLAREILDELPAVLAELD
jgi:ADP-dependent NAD(P)H-hydrate dehydratase